MRHKADERTQLEHAHQDEQNTCHNGGQEQAVHTLSRHHTRHHGGKGGGGTRNLDAATAQQRHHKAGGDGGVHTALRRHAGRQRQGDGQRQGDNRHDDTGNQVTDQLPLSIPFQRRNNLRHEVKVFHSKHLFSLHFLQVSLYT